KASTWPHPRDAARPPPPPATPMHRRDPGADKLTVHLRPTRPEDLPALFELEADPESNQMAGTKPRTRAALLAAWERNFDNPASNSRVIELDGVTVGSISCFQADGDGGHDDIGYWIARAHWGKGIASRALTIFLGEERRRP